MSALLDVLVGLLEVFGIELDVGRSREDALRGVRTARTPAEARDLLHRLADRLDLRPTEVGSGAFSMQGDFQSFATSVEVRYARAESQIRFEICAELRPRTSLPGPLRISAVESAPRGAWPIGDARFDASLRVSGDESRALAVLDPTVREYVLGLGGQLELEADRIRVCATRAATFLPGLLETLVALCRMLLASPRADAERLAARYDAEPLAPVRRRVLSALLRGFPGASPSRAAARRALDDPSPRIRLVAANHLGPEGRACLRSLVTDTGLEPDLRLAAARRLDIGDDWVLSRLEAQLLESDEAALAAVRVLGRLGRTRSRRSLVELSEDGRRGWRVREAARHALARIDTRYPEADGGQLSLVGEEEAGALSLGDEVGQVSLPKTDPDPDPKS